ncbi:MULTISPECIES: ferrous iron transport protein B [unclassified Fibrobacter]|uniref:ferrous iron transport protein B n=1 Tax=unclassified Fibrobacter TaxID=2634177 RepID=UPI000D6B1AFB|nr:MULTISPECIES: ferrous iron transport protein B [unclassified Fibrobacter]PWJ59779.1 ferrous iron transport protein B [Fibrobacter sp. UWR4]PZW68045.1 ferrous iron transport protein B [Fibrobacter sp. UWR1]
MSPKPFTIAIAGNPNCGKTALFNALTGSRQNVGNWPGVTVEKKEGFFDLGSRHIRVVDLPGTYAIFANSEDERAAVDFLLTREADLIVNIVDASNIERNLFLTSQLVDMQQPMVIAVNMMDIAEKRGLHIDMEALSKRFGVPVVPLSAVSEKSVTNFISQMAHVISSQFALPTALTYGEKVETVVKELEPQVEPVAKLLDADPRWVALMYLGNEKSYADKFVEAGVTLDKAAITAKLGEESEFVLADARYSMAHDVAGEVIVGDRSKKTFSDKLDSVLLNRWLSLPIFMVVMYLVFWVAVTIGSAFIDFFDVLFGAIFVDGLGYLLGDVIGAPAWITAILADGVGAGIQTVSTFIPVIFFMFLCLTFLEDSGYMARAAFVADRFMRFLGLPGRAFVPMMVGFGCGVPGIMGSRVLESKRERFLTIFLVPFMSCGARLPVYALFAAAFFGKQAGTIVFALYLVGIVFAIVYGLFLKKSLFMGQSSNFVMELPNYHLPKLKSLLIHSWLKLKDYVLRAGKVITIAVAVLGFLNAFGYVDGKFTAGNADSENSLLSSVGKTITPVFEPFGVEEDNWPASVSLFTGLLAKEAVIGTMNSLYSMAPKSEAVEGPQAEPAAPSEAAEIVAEEAPAVETAPVSEPAPSPEGETVAVTDSTAPGVILSEGPAAPGVILSEGVAEVEESSGEAASESAAEPTAETVAVAEPAEEEKPLIAGVDECPAEEEEDGAPDLKAAFIEAVSSIPANLSEVFGSLTDILGTSGELEAQSAAELKKETLDKIQEAKVLTCEEYAAIETFGEEEDDEKTREEVFAKLAAAGVELDEDAMGALEEGDLSETADIYANLRSYFHNGGHDGFNWQVFAFLVFILLYVPCLAAMGVVVREIGLGLGVLMATVQTILAWAIAVLLYQIPVGGSTGWIVTAVIVLIGTGIFLKLFGMKANKEKRFED